VTRARRTKFGNVRTNGFASKKEARRYQELQLLEKAGEIRSLRCQVTYKLQAYDVNLGVYRADFVYEQFVWPGSSKECRTVVEDVKGVRTPVYRLKKRLMLACHRIEILET
jgi:hypothetical protein